jgi:aspartate--ammonia ligase
MEHEVWYKYPQAVCHLADKVTFITSQELEDRYPDLSVKDRETAITREKGCVFIKQIGWPLKRSGRPHDGRAPDYDDWNLNGDLLFWLPSLSTALEISSMGIRVDEKSIRTQCKASHCEGRLTLPYHQMILNKELPYTIGGGIGQSRLCMLLLNKAHVGEVQASIWPDDMVKICEKNNIPLL